MRKLIVGIVLFVMGVYSMLNVHQTVVGFIPAIYEWRTSIGKYGQGLLDTNSIPILIFSYILIIVGIVMMLINSKEN